MKKIKFIIFVLGLICARQALAVNFTVSNANDSGAGSLRQAITDLNAIGTVSSSSIANNINFSSNYSITLLSDLPVINSRGVTINGNSSTVSGISASNPTHRGLATFKASLAVNNLTVTNARALGGDGVDRGGGGLGAGGGIYIDLGQTLTIAGTSISGCIAQGGTNGVTTSFGGGGGGASFTVGPNSKNAEDLTRNGGGDRGGSNGGGGAASQGTTGYGGGTGGTAPSSSPGSGGGNNVGTSGSGGNGGAGGYCGGGGGSGAGSGGGGGGGNGGGNGVSNGGGGGGFGSGGAGAANSAGADAGGGGGGFGGGGGSGAPDTGGGGGGGWGGGGGGASNGGGAGGRFGGAGGGGSGVGGGGAGVGGGIFVGDSAILEIGNTVTVSGNSAVGGAGSTPGTGFANNLFLFRSAQVKFINTSTLSVPYVIDADSSAPVGNLDAGIAKNGSGTVTLSAANTFRGPTAVNAGILQAGIANTIQSSSSLVMADISGAVFDLNNFNQSIVELSGGGSTGGNITLGSATLTINQTSTTSYGGSISGSGGITKNSAGILTLSGNSTYSGTTTLNAGTIILGNNNAFGTSGVTVSGNFALQTDATRTIGNTIGLNTSTVLTLSGSNDLTLGGIISGNGGLTKTTSGILTLSGANTYSGPTTLTTGTTVLGNNTALGTSAVTVNGNIALQVNSNRSITNSISINTSNILTISGSNDFTLNGAISGNGGLTKTSSGVLTLGAANNYTGTTIISTGTLRTGIVNAIASSSSVSLADTSGAIFDLNNFSQNVNNLSGGGATGGNITLGSGALTVNQTSPLTYSGIISGTGGLTKAGAATLILNRASTYTGTTTINAGTLQTGIANAIASTSPVTLANTSGAIFSLNGFSQSVGSLSGGGTTGGNISLGSATLTVNQTSNLAYGGVISGTGGVTKSGAAALTISGNQTYTGATLISSGTLISDSATLQSSITNNATVEINTSLNTTGNYSGSGVTKFDITNATTFDQLIVGGSANLSSSTVNVTTGSVTNDTSWQIITAGSLTAPSAVTGLPASSIFAVWDYEVTPTSLTITYNAQQIPDFIPSGVDTQIANIIQGFINNPTNSAQQQLADAFTSLTTEEQAIDGINQLRANQNATAPFVQMQNSIFSYIQNRIARSEEEEDEDEGYSSGELNPNRTAWIAPFGRIAKQTAYQENAGYRSVSTGLLIGIDQEICEDSLIGGGIGFSNTKVTEFLNDDDNTRLTGYHALLYGNTNMKNNQFIDWLVTGSYNHNKGTRIINIGSYNFNTSSDYNGWMVGGIANLGVNYICEDYFEFSPLLYSQYALLHQPEYQETGSAAALNVSTQLNQSILTLGTGFKLHLPHDNWWLFGSENFRALVTYDAIGSSQEIVANFIAGGSNFSVTNNTPRFSLRLGVDMAYVFFDNLQMQLSFDYQVRSRYTDYSGFVKIKYLF